MKAKLFEVRDAATFIPVLAVQFGSEHEAERYLASRAGYGRTAPEQARYVWVGKIDGNDSGGTYDPHNWPGISRTMQVAHQHILDNFDTLEPGAVVYVEYILGLQEQPKQSESIDEEMQFSGPA